jgi:creatinine amidohydrolase
MKRTALLAALLAIAFLIPTSAQTSNPAKGILLEDLTWLEAEKVLTRESVVVIPIGAAAKEHGPHLKLKNDSILAEYLKNRVLAASNVVIAPTVTYHYYPAFVEYEYWSFDIARGQAGSRAARRRWNRVSLHRHHQDHRSS